MKSKSARLVRRNHARYHQGRDDLNIVPMIDMMVILVFFLIFTAVFSKTNILQLNLPANNSAPVELNLIDWAERIPMATTTPGQESFHALSSFTSLSPFI